MSKASEFIQECKRVFRITKKPTKEEYKSIALISGLGILVIGLIGAILTIISNKQVLGLQWAIIIAVIAIIVLMLWGRKKQ
ncbi:protein translocase SEC61 complex subunit gamma [Candidatus Woesearchaeota archaeon]|nr:protein translocase SEC61 complex subunit gamma [Candidatus Woesearchaeota archaeon]